MRGGAGFYVERKMYFQKHFINTFLLVLVERIFFFVSSSIFLFTRFFFLAVAAYIRVYINFFRPVNGVKGGVRWNCSRQVI